MRFSLISLTSLSFLFTLVTALPVLEARQPTKGHAVRPAAPRAGTRNAIHRASGNTAHRAPSNATHRAQAQACARKHKREIEFEYLDRRNLPDHELTYEIGTTYGKGGFGDVHLVVGHPELLAKLANTKYAQNNGNLKQVPVEVFKQEAEAARSVGQLVDWGYKMDASCNKVYYIIMHKVPGTMFDKTTAYIATKGNKEARKALVDKVIAMVAHKIVHYVNNGETWHGDPHGANVMCIEDSNHNIVSVDLVDWGWSIKVEPHTITYDDAYEGAKNSLIGMYLVNA